jgi:hypothetical protein
MKFLVKEENFMTSRWQKMAGLAFVFGMVQMGCSSGPIELKDHDLASQQWVGTAVLLNYELNTNNENIRNDGCVLNFHNLESNQDYAITLRGKEQMALFDLPAGTYVGKLLTCQKYQKWELDSFLKGKIAVEADKINYAGKVFFNFAPDMSALKTVNGDQKQATQSLSSDLWSLPKEWKSALYNPFTHQPIEPEMLVKKDLYRMDIHTSWTLKRGEKIPSTTDLEARLKECDQTEQKRFPYRLGMMTYSATYDAQVLASLTHQDHHSFSDGFVSCVEQTLRTYKPVSPQPLKVTVSL